MQGNKPEIGSGHTGRPRKKILLVDDHPVVRQGLAQLIEAESGLSVCYQASGVSEAMELLRSGSPDVAVVDLTLSDGSGLNLVEQIHTSRPDVPILVLSMHDENVYAERCLRVGAQGYIMKKEPPEKVIEAIRKVLMGEVYLGPEIADHLMRKRGNKSGMQEDEDSVRKLSNRELEVFQMMGSGLGTRDIASRLKLSAKTIETHVEHIKKKLGVHSGREIVVRAAEWVRNGDAL